MRELERRVLLTVLDRKWREHLYEMDYLREGIGLRAMAQRDPLVEYQREGGDMFNAMMEAFMEEVVGFVFHLEVEVTETPTVGVVTGQNGQAVQIGRNGQRQARHLIESGPDPDGPGVAVQEVDEQLVDETELDETEDDDRAEDLAEPVAARPQVKAKGLEPAKRRALSYTAPAEDGSVTTAGRSSDSADPFAGTGRNAPCPCGSGKKYKMCHGRSSN